MIARFGEYRNPQLGVYQALTESLEILRATIHTPVDDGIYAGLISKTLWMNASITSAISPEAAGFINGGYATLKGLAKLPEVALDVTGTLLRMNRLYSG